VPAGLGASALVTPLRIPVLRAPDLPRTDVAFSTNEGHRLRGWYFHSGKPNAPLVIYLHGHNHARVHGNDAFAPLLARAFDVLAYDQRAHGASGGHACTYGYYEKYDVLRAITRFGRGRPVLLFGYSLGAAVALQAAAIDPRVKGVVALASYSDLRAAVGARTGWLPKETVQAAIAVGESQGGFVADEVSPANAASRLSIPVLLVHGAADRQTPADQSRVIFARANAPKELVLIEGAGHNGLLRRPELWAAVDRFLGASGGALRP
jgi:pimeloyl-ACP methyl ester carboxylesterase